MKKYYMLFSLLFLFNSFNAFAEGPRPIGDIEAVEIINAYKFTQASEMFCSYTGGTIGNCRCRVSVSSEGNFTSPEDSYGSYWFGRSYTVNFSEEIFVIDRRTYSIDNDRVVTLKTNDIIDNPDTKKCLSMLSNWIGSEILRFNITDLYYRVKK